MKKYVVITGASSGIGRALTVHFAHEGYFVLAIGRNKAELESTKNMVSTHLQPNVSVISLDLSAIEQIEVLPQHLLPGEKISFLVHCAAIITPYKPIMDISPTEFDAAINTNVRAPLFVTQTLMPFFDTESRVLFIGSDYVGPNPSLGLNTTGCYAMTKTALDVMARYASMESKTFAVGIVNPGSTNTPMLNSVNQAPLYKNSVFSNVTEPTDVAQFIQRLLENTSADVFSTVKWDCRNKDHQARIEPPAPVAQYMPTVGSM